MWAHEHSYERLLPVMNRTVVPSPQPDQPYTDPRAPVHITTGSAGCREKVDPFIKNPPEWSAFRYKTLHLLFTVSSNMAGLVRNIDYFLLRNNVAPKLM